MEQNNQDRQLKELLLLHTVTQKINSILDLDRLLEEVVGDIMEAFGYCRSAILLVDDKTNELEIAAVRGWTKNFHVKGDRFKIGTYGITGHVAETGETHYAPDVTKDKYYRTSEDSTKSEIDIPLKYHGSVIGVFNVQHYELDAFSCERIELLEALAGNITIAIENARLFRKERHEKERMLDELKEARRIQLNLFPKNPPTIPGFKIEGMGLPCLEVGGDWYDYINLKDGRTGIVIADVSGKGIGAALLMSSARSVLRLIAQTNDSPGEVLRQVNNILLNDFQTTQFITLVYGILDPVKRTLNFANAGHLYPLYVNSAESKFLKTSAGIPLGISDSLFTDCIIEFSKDSRLILYTDGLTEAMNETSEEYGMDRLKAHFSKPSASIQTIKEEIKIFATGSQFSDDFTMVILEADF
jgi:sigma-B regulation protein RsbU (phosphoserine phosphatase)